MTRYASRSYFDDLLASGIEVYLYGKGLLHTKSVTADSQVAMFGTVNLDMRSFWLNYEVALYVYDQDCTAAVRKLQQAYILDSQRLDAAHWCTARSPAGFWKIPFGWPAHCCSHFLPAPPDPDAVVCTRGNGVPPLMGNWPSTV